MIDLNIRFDYRRLRICSILYLILHLMLEIFLLLVSCTVKRFYNKRTDIFSYLFMFWGINTLSMFLSQTFLLILSIKQRFEALNHLLENSAPLIRDQQLKTIAQIHLKLTEAIEIMNQTYCMMFMLALAGSFGMFNLFLFSSKSLIAKFNLETFIAYTGKVLMNVYCFILNFMVIAIASSTTKETHRTIRALFETKRNMEKSAEWEAETANFIQQISFSQTKFSCGLFNFDWKLGFKVIFSTFFVRDNSPDY